MIANRQLFRTSLVLLCAMLLVLPSGILDAQGDGDAAALTTGRLNLRAGPGTGFDVITTLPREAEVLAEARDPSFMWVLVHTPDGTARGWAAARYLLFTAGVVPANLPVSEENLAAPAAAPPDTTNAPAVGDPAAESASFITSPVRLNVRGGPAQSAPKLATVDRGAVLIPEARNADASWILAHTPDRTVRGWLASAYLDFGGVDALALPESGETVTAAPSAPTTGGSSPASSSGGGSGGSSGGSSSSGGASTSSGVGSTNLAAAAQIDLNAVPIVGRATGRARQIFRAGQSRGNNAKVVSKVGDCMTSLHYFLSPFGHGEYNLGAYAGLRPALQHFTPSLAFGSLAAEPGFVAPALLDSIWSHPDLCQPDESPLQCEYRTNRPAVAVIMIGAQDVYLVPLPMFDGALRQIVYETIQAGIIPVLSTFPSTMSDAQTVIQFNQVVVQVARDFDVPLMNLWLAAQSLPDGGLKADGLHLTSPPSEAEAGLMTPGYVDRYGFNLRNLITLQTLDAIWRGAMN